MNTRSPLDASLSPKASPLVPQVKTASAAAARSFGDLLMSGFAANPYVAAGLGATAAALASRLAPGAYSRALASNPYLTSALPAFPLGLAGAGGAVAGRHISKSPTALGALAAATGYATLPGLAKHIPRDGRLLDIATSPLGLSAGLGAAIANPKVHELAKKIHAKGHTGKALLGATALGGGYAALRRMLASAPAATPGASPWPSVQTLVSRARQAGSAAAAPAATPGAAGAIASRAGQAGSVAAAPVATPGAAEAAGFLSGFSPLELTAYGLGGAGLTAGAVAALRNQAVRQALATGVGGTSRFFSSPGAPRRALMGATAGAGASGAAKLLAPRLQALKGDYPTLGAMGDSFSGFTGSDIAGLGLGGAALGVLASQPVRQGLSAAGRGSAQYATGATPFAQSMRSAATTGASLSGIKYLNAPAAGEVANFYGALTPGQIAAAAAASAAGRYAYPYARPHMGAYFRRRRELEALERLERARAADPREQLKRFLFGAPKESSYGLSPLSAPLTKTAGSLMAHPGMDKEAFVQYTARVLGKGRQVLTGISRGAGRLFMGRSKTPFTQTEIAQEFNPNFMNLTRKQQAEALSGVGSNEGVGFLGRLKNAPGNFVRRTRASFLEGRGGEHLAERGQQAQQGALGRGAQQRMLNIRDSDELSAALTTGRAEALNPGAFKPAPMPAQNFNPSQRAPGINTGNPTLQIPANFGPNSPTLQIPANFGPNSPTLQIPVPGANPFRAGVDMPAQVSEALGETVRGAVSQRAVPSADAAIDNLARRLSGMDLRFYGVNASNPTQVRALAKDMLQRDLNARGGYATIEEGLAAMARPNQTVSGALKVRRAEGAARSMSPNAYAGVPDSYAGLPEQLQRENQLLRQLGTEARATTKSQQVLGEGQYAPNTRGLTEATDAGAGLDQVGLPIRDQVLGGSRLLEDVGTLDDLAGSVGRQARNESLLEARRAVSAEINRVNADLAPDIAAQLNARNLDGTALADQMRRSGALREIGDAIASNRPIDMSVLKAEFKAATNASDDVAEALFGANGTLTQRVNSAVTSAGATAEQAALRARASLEAKAVSTLGETATASVARVNEQLEQRLSMLGEDAAAIVQRNMEVLAKNAPKDAKSQAMAAGLIDDLAEGLASNDPNAIKKFNAAITELRAGRQVTYTTKTVDAAGNVTRGGQATYQIPQESLGNFERAYLESGGVKVDDVRALRAAVGNDVTQLVDDAALSPALAAQVGDQGMQLIRRRPDIAKKLLSGSGSLSRQEMAILAQELDPAAVSQLPSGIRDMIIQASRGIKLSGGNSAGIVDMEAAMAQIVENHPSVRGLRNIDFTTLAESINANNLKFRLAEATPNSTERMNFVRRILTSGAPQAGQQGGRGGALAAPVMTTAAGTAIVARGTATASYGGSPLSAPVVGSYKKMAVALEEEDLSDPGSSPMKAPVFKPPVPKNERSALLSSGALGVGTYDKMGSFMAPPVLRSRAG